MEGVGFDSSRVVRWMGVSNFIVWSGFIESVEWNLTLLLFDSKGVNAMVSVGSMDVVVFILDLSWLRRAAVLEAKRKCICATDRI